MRHAWSAAVLFTLVGLSPARAQYGDLAPGSAMSWTLAGVRMEAGVTFAVAPKFTKGRLPRGFQPFTLSELATAGDSAARATLRIHPDFADHVITTLAVASLDSMVVVGDTTPARPLTVGFWWVPVRLADSSAQLPDSRARVGEQLVELGLWAGDEPFGKRLGALMPTAIAMPVVVTWDGVASWRIRLRTSDGDFIVGRCLPMGTPTAAQYPLPHYSTVWAADSVPRSFAVFTYYGHQAQPCRGSWRATGQGDLAVALRTGAILRTENQIGWRARAAVYTPR